MFRISLGDERLNPALAQRPADFPLGVVGTIGVRLFRPLASSAARTLDRGNRDERAVTVYKFEPVPVLSVAPLGAS